MNLHLHSNLNRRYFRRMSHLYINDHFFCCTKTFTEWIIDCALVSAIHHKHTTKGFEFDFLCRKFNLPQICWVLISQHFWSVYLVISFHFSNNSTVMRSIYNYPVGNDKPATQSNQIQIMIEIRFDSINICTKRNKPNAKQICAADAFTFKYEAPFHSLNSINIVQIFNML